MTEKFEQVKLEVDEVKDIMVGNIGKMTKNMDNLEDLEDKTAGLREKSEIFAKRSKDLRRQLWWKNMKLKLCIAFIFLFILFIFILTMVIKYRN